MALQVTREHGMIPARAGVGLKADHYRTILETSPDIGFFEVHAENYSAPLSYCDPRSATAIRSRSTASVYPSGRIVPSIVRTCSGFAAGCSSLAAI